MNNAPREQTPPIQAAMVVPWRRGYSSPARLVMIATVTVFVVELLVMLFLSILPPLPHLAEALLDAILATSLVLPIFNIYLLRPLTRHIAERNRAEQALQKAHDELERRVQERTAELARAVESLQIEVAERKRAEGELRGALEISQRRQAEVAALLAASRAVLQYRDFHESARSIFDTCKALLGATAGYVALAKDNTNEAIFLDTGGYPCSLNPSLPMPIRGLREQAYHSGQTVYENDFSHSGWLQLLPAGHASLDNVLFTPLVIERSVVGLLGLANKPGGFTEEDARMASAFGEIAAIACLNGRTMELLENSEQRFRSVAETASEAIITVDRGGHITFWNQAAETIFGYSAAETASRPLSFIMSERYRDLYKIGWDQIISTGQANLIGKTVELAGLRRDGSEFPIKLSLSKWETREGLFFTSIIRDITERKEAEEALRLSEHKFSTLFEKSAFVIALARLSDGVLVQVNEAWETAFGYTRQETVGKTPLELGFDLGAEERARLLAALQVHGSAHDVEVVLRTKSGEARIGLWNLDVIDIGDQKYIVSTVQDITQRKQMEETLWQRNEELEAARTAAENEKRRLEAVMEALPVGVAITDARGGNVRSNLAYEEIWGKPRPAVHSISDYAAYHAWWMDTGKAVLPEEWASVQVVQKGVPVIGQLMEIERFDGSRAFVINSASPVRDFSGAIVGSAVAIQDVTELRKAEEAVRRNEAMLRAVLDQMPSGVTVRDARTGALILYNNRAQELLGALADDFAQFSQYHALHPDGRPYLTEDWPVWRTMATGKAVDEEEIACERSDGARFILGARSAPVRDLQGRIVFGVALFHDITERKRAEERITWLASFPELNPNPVVEVDVTGHTHYLNPAAKRLLPDLEMTGLQHPWLADLEWLGQQVQADHTAVLTREITLGNAIYQQTVSYVPHNQRVRLYSVDITARKRAEDELRYAQAQLEQRVLERTAELAAANNELRLQSTALQAAANGIIITDRQGNIQWANPAFTQMTGYTAAEVLGHNPRFLKSGQHNPDYYQQMWSAILAGQVWRGETTNRRKDGSLYIEEQTITPVMDEHGDSAHFIAIKQDITERKRAELQLERNNRELRALTEAERALRHLAETLRAASLALTQSLDLDTVLQTLLEYLERLIPYDSANVILLETESRLSIRAVRGYERWADPEQVRALTFDVATHSIFRDLLTTRKSIRIADTRDRSDWERREGLHHVRSWLGVPLVTANSVIGLYALDKVEPGFFTPEHVQIAEALVGQAAVAVQNAWLFEQVRAGRERLQVLSRRLVEVQETERSYVARELHDEAGQALTSLMVGLRLLEREAQHPAAIVSGVAELKQVVDGVLENLHRLAMDLRPASLDHLGLVAALRQHVEAVSDKHGLVVQYEVVGFGEERLLSEIETALYRIVQEALTNAVRHARATRVDVLLKQRNDKVMVLIEDNGVGFDPAALQGEHLGLFGMRERAEMLGGTLVIESTSGGTTVLAEVPCVPANSHRG